MVAILGRVKVKSFEWWLPVFQRFAGKRAEFGCSRETVYVPPSDGGDVYILFEWTSEAAFQKYLGSAVPQPVREAAGVLSPPEHTVLGEAVA